MRERYRAFVRRAFDEQVQQDEEQFRAAQVPLYGLPPSFQGPRTAGKRRVAGAGWGARDLDTVTGISSSSIAAHGSDRPAR
jgi:hypothetical protein